MRKAFLFGTSALFFAQIVFVLAGLVVNFGLGRLLGVSDYGTYGVVISLIGLITLVFSSGIQITVSKFVSQNSGFSEAIKQAALRLNLSLGLVLAVIYFFAAPFIASALNDVSLTPFIQLSALIIPGYLLYPVFLGYFNGLKNYNLQSFLLVSYSFAKVFLIIGLVLLGASIFGAVVGFALAPLVVLTIGLGLSPLRKTGKSFNLLKLFRIGLPVTVFVLFLRFAMLMGLFSVKSFMVESVFAGYYTAAFQISNLPYFFNAALCGVVFPLISHSVSNKSFWEARQHFLTALRYFFLLVVPVSLFISVFAPQIISLLFTPQFLGGASALSVLAIANIFICLFTLLSFVLIAVGRHKEITLLSLLVLALSFAFNWLLVPFYHLWGAAVATLLAFLIGSALASIAVWRFLPRQLS